MRPPGLGRRSEIISQVTQAVMSGDLSPADLVEITAAIAAATPAPAPAAGADTMPPAPAPASEAQEPAVADTASVPADADTAAVPTETPSAPASAPGCWHTIAPPAATEPQADAAVASVSPTDVPVVAKEPEATVVRIASISCEGGAEGNATVVTQADAASVAAGTKRTADEDDLDPEDQQDAKRPRHWPPSMPAEAQ